MQADGDVRDSRRQAEEDFRARQAAEAEKDRALRQVENLQAELDGVRIERDQQRKEADGRVRGVQDSARVAREQLEDAAAARDDAARLAEREAADLRSRMAAVQRTNQELEEAKRAGEVLLEQTRNRLVETEQTIGRLEADVLRLKAQTGDADTMAVIRRDLADQVRHIRALEATNREQLSELKHLRHTHRAVEMVEEEKRTLQRKLDAAAKMETELGEEGRRRLYLEEERQAWASYLQREGRLDGGELDSPQAVARALAAERIQSAQLKHRLGELQPEMAERDHAIAVLENEKARLCKEVEKFTSQAAVAGGVSGAGAGADSIRRHLEKQRVLAAKEADYLRAQLKAYDDMDMNVRSDGRDEHKSLRIRELEGLVDQYKAEVTALHEDIRSADARNGCVAMPPAVGAKRPREPEDDATTERLGALMRKSRRLQDDLSTLQASHELLQREHDVSTGQLSAAREQLKTRILSLRSNPTSDYEAVKTATLAALKQENAELVAHMRQGWKAAGGSGKLDRFTTVPMSQLAAAQREVAAARAETASAEKQARRLKEVWAAKSAEFREAVFSTLGWNVSFIPGGKMRLESVYQPSADPDEHENSIVFDGERGTMKVGGGPHSAFAARIADTIKYWVRDKGCVPCFLAALTLEFYEEHADGAASA